MLVPRSPMPQVIAAVQRGQWVEAIRILLDAPSTTAQPQGVPSAAADLEKRRQADRAQAAATHPTHTTQPAQSFGMPAPLPPAVTDALAKGKKLEAIRLLRQQQGIGLAQAKARVEDHVARHLDSMPHLAPGQVDDNATGSLLLLVAVLVGFGVYTYFKG